MFSSFLPKKPNKKDRLISTTSTMTKSIPILNKYYNSQPYSVRSFLESEYISDNAKIDFINRFEPENAEKLKKALKIGQKIYHINREMNKLNKNKKANDMYQKWSINLGGKKYSIKNKIKTRNTRKNKHKP